MFTGIITEIGTVQAVEKLAAGLRLTIGCSYDMGSVALGASIAHDGACLTVVSKVQASYTVEISPETLSKTTLGQWQVGQEVNLERALQAGQELGGHFVTGHVDAVGRVARFEPQQGFWLLEIEYPAELSNYFAKKGSVTVNGVSLTVNDVAGQRLMLTIIPHTAAVTTLGQLQLGDKVNLEVDILARYIAPYLENALRALGAHPPNPLG